MTKKQTQTSLVKKRKIDIVRELRVKDTVTIRDIADNSPRSYSQICSMMVKMKKEGYVEEKHDLSTYNHKKFSVVK